MSMVKCYRLIATSTTRFCSHSFMSEELAMKPPSVDDNVNPVAPGTSAEAGGSKADQEELQGHHPNTTWRNMEKP